MSLFDCEVTNVYRVLSENDSAPRHWYRGNGIGGETLTHAEPSRTKAPVKEDVMGRLKLAMEHGKLTLPRDETRLLVQITSQRCEPTMSGTLKFSHPTGTHDDQLWSLALANYASQQ